MKSRLLSLTAIALVGLAVLGSSTPARAAVDVTYTTIGTFTGLNGFGSQYIDAANGVTITYLPVLADTVSVNPPPATGLSLGVLDTTGTTTGTLVGLNGGLDIQIFQSDPSPTTPGSLILVGTLHGSLSSSSTTAFVQFTGFTPAVLPGLGAAGFIGTLTSPTAIVSYYITEADNGVLGKANINPPGGLPSAIEGALTLSAVAVPEPASIVMVGMAIPLGLLMLRRRAKGDVAG